MSDREQQLDALADAIYWMQMKTWLCDPRVKAKFLYDRGIRAPSPPSQEKETSP